MILHNYGVIISECQKVTFMGVEAKKNVKKWGKNKVAQNCLSGHSALGEAVAQAPGLQPYTVGLMFCQIACLGWVIGWVGVRFDN